VCGGLRGDEQGVRNQLRTRALLGGFAARGIADYFVVFREL